MSSYKKRNDGYSVKRLREILGIKQEIIAEGLKMDQSQISRLESKEIIEEELLVQIANILHIPVESIKNYTEEGTMNFFSNWYDNSASNNENSYYNTGSAGSDYNLNFGLVDKIVELYERLLEAEKSANGKTSDNEN